MNNKKNGADYLVDKIIYEKLNKKNKLLSKKLISKLLSEAILDIGAGNEDPQKADPLWVDLLATPLKSTIDFLTGKISKVKNLIRNKFESISDKYFLDIINSGNANVIRPNMYSELLNYINMEDPSAGTEIKAIKSKSMENVLDMQFKRMRAEFTGTPWKENIEKYLDLIRNLALELNIHFKNLKNDKIGYDLAIDPAQKKLSIYKNIKDLISRKKKILLQLKIKI